MAWCERCDRYFPFDSALAQHRRDSANHYYVCYECGLDFSTWLGLKEHWVQSPRHYYCQYCEDHFDDEYDLEDHYQSSHHYCESCRRVFKNEHGLHEHYRQSPQHHYCPLCKVLYRSANNLQMHLKSSAHMPRDVSCPFLGCDMAFVSKSALILHLESGGCRSGVNRRMIDNYIKSVDRTNIITDPSRLLTSGYADQTHYFATNASWNGHAFECVLCHSQFRGLVDLNRHLASPRHQDKIYRCPLNTCRENFATLSGLCQHVESERCGVAKFKAVKNAMDDLLSSSMMRLTL
ncbi:hypothetical protein BJ138DRAFT_997285 [Hygrophoropsis aurantiaca]|uniref:Uncharacterized protein n=1 Tax=Hygrophoropsis aurantiaca TaxID=72124 RepID=A0ACB8AR10_9AGAM|nr:hypothetical protein BJ138DRAFT_997285 [Hygrophoropsis aurantiaca]